jgi:triacylglycerol lipase
VISRRRGVVLPAVLVVITLAVVAAVWFRLNQSPAPVAQDRPGPVLLVPGRNADSAALVDLQRRLFLSGRRAVIVSTGIEDTGDLRTQAEQVDETAQKLITAGAPSVDVVGYSGGGVVTRLWLAEGGFEVARRVVTIGSPSQGATEAQLAELVTKRFCPTTCPQLSPGSSLLKDLPKADGSTPWVNLWTTRDQVVPEESAQVPGAINVSLQSVCPKDKSTHATMPTDPLVIGIVVKAVALSPVTTAPTKADCATLRRDGSSDLLPDSEPTE